MQNTTTETTKETTPEVKKREWDKPQIGGLYRKVTVAGKTYLSGFINLPDQFGIPQGNVRIVVYPNDYKTEDKHPDMRVYLDTPSDEVKKNMAKRKESQSSEVKNQVKPEEEII